ncbi:hypothetical protein DPSP01_011124 [Paraphaeosphaeria sporulosa]|uniref:Uncharacterized protein n=1 Tax=Paraphaeosphaeria sporulosa TaxID=1460663 RepID=A0A177C381_9PLEO|nr:uncharacterized protein CC84DRAFT_1221108 [Paraphaeosphaeria sporulosa]OAG01621.1 hypothetical protein CC84DRAFT_1221108 [Paraphaeosphaeria sporulosa]
MRFSNIIFTLVSAATILAAPAPEQDESLSDSVLVCTYTEQYFKGELVKIRATRAVDDYPDQDGGTAVCSSVKPNFASSISLANLQHPGWDGLRPSACKLYSQVAAPCHRVPI